MTRFYTHKSISGATILTDAPRYVENGAGRRTPAALATFSNCVAGKALFVIMVGELRTAGFEIIAED